MSNTRTRNYETNKKICIVGFYDDLTVENKYSIHVKYKTKGYEINQEKKNIYH
jgi:hypothetical protein